MTPIAKDEVEREFRADLKKLKCLNCGEHITDAAIDWGWSQPSEYAKDGPFPIKCELCETEQLYEYFSRTLTLRDRKEDSTR